MLIGVAYLDSTKLHDHIREVITCAVHKLEGDRGQISIRASELRPDVDLRFADISSWKLKDLCSSVPIDGKKVRCRFATLMANKGIDLCVLGRPYRRSSLTVAAQDQANWRSQRSTMVVSIVMTTGTSQWTRCFSVTAGIGSLVVCNSCGSLPVMHVAC